MLHYPSLLFSLLLLTMSTPPQSSHLAGKFSTPEKTSKLASPRHQGYSTRCQARRQVRYDDEDEEEHENNEEIAMLEFYSQVAKNEALLVKAVVDDEEVEILVFKGFSSSLSSGTSFDPTRSILPTRAVIKCIDRVKGPFDPSNIDYIEKDLTVGAFKTVVQKIKDVRDNLQWNS
ncbi:hypothetical protein OSB04_un000611 [Centaurea solstitialis]|uniref:DUF7734 domain-containing protein n=1 Tax=Centaurea solstitialis TaxID=347529 RepID=A0AA38SN88_9ASTR|nr:hypothetical protein OSB04_un000611 [Centaurea solstitialis]